MQRMRGSASLSPSLLLSEKDDFLHHSEDKKMTGLRGKNFLFFSQPGGLSHPIRKIGEFLKAALRRELFLVNELLLILK